MAASTWTCRDQRVWAAKYYDEGMDGRRTMHGAACYKPALQHVRGAEHAGLFYMRCVEEYEAGGGAQAVLLLKPRVGSACYSGALDCVDESVPAGSCLI